MNKFNYVQPADSRLPASFQGTLGDPDEPDVRLQLYADYALPHESLEDFCDRMADDYGPWWPAKLIHKTIRLNIINNRHSNHGKR